MKIIMMHKYLR